MSPYSLQERLDIYKQALEDWKESIPSRKQGGGFCAYFLQVVPDWQQSDFQKLLPELFAQKPIQCVTSELGLEYWFEFGTEHGRKLRRIALISAIEICEIILKGHE